MHDRLGNNGSQIQFFYTLASVNGELLLGGEKELDFSKVVEEALAALE